MAVPLDFLPSLHDRPERAALTPESIVLHAASVLKGLQDGGQAPRPVTLAMDSYFSSEALAMKLLPGSVWL